MRKYLLLTVFTVFLFSASLVSAAQVMVKDFQAEKGTVSVWKIAKALNHPGWDGVNALRKSDPNLPPLKKIRKILDIRIFPNTRITIPENWSYEGIDRSVVEPFPPIVKSEPTFNPKGAMPGLDKNQREPRSIRLFPYDYWLSIVWIAFFVAIILALTTSFLLLRNRMRQSATGQPIIPGGITSDRLQEVEDRFNRIAERHYGETNPQADLSAERPTRISRIEDGFLNGHGRVQYRDRIIKRRLENEPAYRARFRFPNGDEQELYFLQVCGNDVYAGARYHGFTFTASRVIVSAPMPASTEAGTHEVAKKEPKTNTDSSVAAEKPTIAETSPVEEASTLQESVETSPSVAEDVVVASAEVAQTPKKVKVTIGSISIEVTGNGKIPATKIEMENGTTVLLQQ